MYFLCELPHCVNWWSVVGFSNDWPPTCETFILWRKLCVSPKNVDEEHHFWAKKIPLKLTPELVATLKFSDWMGCASITTWFPFPLRWGWIGLLLQQKKHNFTCGKCGLKWRRGTNFANLTLRSHLDLDVLSCLEAVHSCLRYVKHWVPTGQIKAHMAGALELRSVWVRLVLILCHTALWELFCCEMWESSYAPCAAAKTSPLLLFLFKQQQ